MLAVGPSSVKRWADEGVLACVRTAGGHRRFRKLDVERFAGMRPRRVSSASELAIDLLGARDLHRVLSLLHGERSRTGSWIAVAESCAAALAVMGERWAAGEITVLAEHTASERLTRALGWLSESIPVGDDAPHYLLVAATDEQHTLGLALAELCLRAEGWRGDLVGRMPPLPDLVARLREGGIDLLAVSASSVTEARALADLYGRLSRVADETGVALVLGGAGPWPDAPRRGFRIRDFVGLAELVRSGAWVRE